MLGSNEIDYFTDNLDGLNELTISFDQWADFSGATQDALNTWDTMAGNTLSVVPEPNCLTLALFGLGAVLGVRRRRR